MATERQIQEWVHRIEEGHWKHRVQFAVLISTMAAMFVCFVLDPWYMGLFKGLSHPKVMEQAQIARELSLGNGFSTKMIRPLAYGQFISKRGSAPTTRMPDTFHAPLWPMALMPAFKLINLWPDSFSPYRAPIKDRWEMSTREVTYIGDRVVSGMAVIFFFLAVWISFLTARRIFDHLLGVWTVVLTLSCGLLWRFALSGLPQMLMLFLFSWAVYAMVRAMEAQNEARSPRAWLAFMALLFGLMTLANGLCAWTFLGALIYCVAHFKSRLKTFLVMASIFGLVYSPWIARNYVVSHTMFGTSPYVVLSGIRGSEAATMRSMDQDFTGLNLGSLRRKLQSSASEQMGALFDNLGRNLAAPVFFLALLHLFKKSVPRSLRWAGFSMWSFSALGMAIFGLDDEGSGLRATDLNVLFIPLFSTFGMAFILVLWSRLELAAKPLRYTFFGIIFCLSALPLLNMASLGGKSPVQWPPYMPPSIALLREWTAPDEVIASDMPWAVAWYGNRRSLWLPSTVQEFLDFNSSDRFGGKIAGIYLTPVSCNKPLISDIVKGDFKEWAPFILRSVNIKDFPMRSVIPMPAENECIFYSDRDRWTDRLD